MNSLWVFGDSYSKEFNDVYPPYIKFQGYEPKVYGEIISEKLNLNLKNFAHPGCDNYSILNYFINEVDKIEKNDIVIIGWTEIIRFRAVNTAGIWVTAHLNTSWAYPLSKKTTEEIIKNRLDEQYLYELNQFIKLINFALKDILILHWSWSDFYDKVDLDFPLKKFERIHDIMPNTIDSHYSEKGQLDLANMLLTKIGQN